MNRSSPPVSAASRTDELIAHLAERGHRVAMVWVRDSAVDLAAAHPRALHADAHALALLADGALVDVTRRQFDPAAELPQFYASMADLARHWREINVDPDRNEAWSVLAAGDAGDHHD